MVLLSLPQRVAQNYVRGNRLNFFGEVILMYLAPRCRLICARCSTRSRVESVHLRFLYVSWVQIDVSQIGLFFKHWG